MIASMRMIAKIPTLAAMAYKYTIGQPFNLSEEFALVCRKLPELCFAVPCEDYKINPVLADALDKIFILHADHEQNASTSTVRIAGSSGATPSPASPPASPACGGRRMAARTKRRWRCCPRSAPVDKIPDFIRRVKDKNSEVRLMGFGHRVYKNYDRAPKIMHKMCHAS